MAEEEEKTKWDSVMFSMASGVELWMSSFQLLLFFCSFSIVPAEERRGVILICKMTFVFHLIPFERETCF